MKPHKYSTIIPTLVLAAMGIVSSNGEDERAFILFDRKHNESAFQRTIDLKGRHFTIYASGNSRIVTESTSELALVVGGASVKIKEEESGASVFDEKLDFRFEPRDLSSSKWGLVPVGGTFRKSNSPWRIAIVVESHQIQDTNVAEVDVCLVIEVDKVFGNKWSDSVKSVNIPPIPIGRFSILKQ